MALRRAALAAVLVAGAVQANPYFDPSRTHHTPTGFRNNHVERIDKPLADLLRWRWQAWRDDLPRPPQQATPQVLPELARLRANTAPLQRAALAGRGSVPSATWIGHATVLVQSGGLNVLTDPVFSERASPVQFLGPKRAQAPGIALADLPPIDVVVISHNHYDHMDLASLVQLHARGDGRTLFLVPLGIAPLLERHGIRNVQELDWWDSRVVQGVEFHLAPVQHWSARGLGDRNATLWGGWAVFAPDLRWYFSGDAGYSADFAATRAHFAPRARDGAVFDLALLAIGAYEPRWFMREQHMNPAEAVRAHQDLGARRSLGIHWGTFALTDEPLDQPPRDLAAARTAAGLPEDAFAVLAIGQTRWLAEPAQAPGKQGQSTP